MMSIRTINSGSTDGLCAVERGMATLATKVKEAIDAAKKVIRGNVSVEME